MKCDPVLQALVNDGYVLYARLLHPENPDSVFVGWYVIYEGAEFIFRTEDQTVILVYYGMPLDAPKRGLSSNFRPLVRWVHYLKRLGIVRLRGCVHRNAKRHPSGMSDERMCAFYQRMGVPCAINDNGYIWADCDVQRFIACVR